MKSLRSLFLVFFTSAFSPAGPIESAVVAAMRLSEEPSYTWTTAVQDDAQAYTVNGKTVKDSYTWVRMPVVDAIAARLGRESETEIEAFFQGPDRCVIRVGNAWKTVDELPRPRRPDMVLVSTSAPIGWDPSLPASTNGIVILPRAAPLLVLPAPPDNNRPFSNAQLALSAPHEELGIIVSSCENVSVTGDVVTGSIGDIGARLLLAPAERDNVTPLLGAGLFKLWLKDDLVTRYQLRLEGVFLVGKKTVLVHQTSETTVKEVGRTSFVIPAAARAKLGH